MTILEARQRKHDAMAAAIREAAKKTGCALSAEPYARSAELGYYQSGSTRPAFMEISIGITGPEFEAIWTLIYNN